MPNTLLLAPPDLKTYLHLCYSYCLRNNSVTFITQTPLHIGIANFKVGWFNFSSLEQNYIPNKISPAKVGTKETYAYQIVKQY